MLKQSADKIVYTFDRSRAIAGGCFCLCVASPFLVSAFIWYCYGRVSLLPLPADPGFTPFAYFCIGAAFAWASLYLYFRQLWQPDQVTISSAGLSYFQYGRTLRYTWQDVGPPTRTHSRDGSVQIDSLTGPRPIQIVPDYFGCRTGEFIAVVSAARHGEIIDAAAARTKDIQDEMDLEKRYRPFTIVCLAILITIFGIVLYLAR